MKQWLANIENEWPSLKYLGFGCYYAWIFLSYSSSVLFSEPSDIFGLSAQKVMYLTSTSALAISLILAGLAHRHVTKLVTDVKVVLVAAVVASVSTAFVAWGGQVAESPLFWAGCILTGVGTAFVSLRFGCIYSTMGARKALTNVSAAFVLAGGVYFVATGVPHELSLFICVFLPFMGHLCTINFDAKHASKPTHTVIPVKNLPRRFFQKLVFAIAVFSAIAGFYCAIDVDANTAGLSFAGSGNPIIVFSVIVVALIFLVVGGAVNRNFDISKLYYPIIVIACFGIIVAPLLGGYSSIQRTVIAITYNVFIMFVWCLLAHVSSRTDMPPVRVFGFGRGASAVGTTVGWLASVMLAPNLAESSDSLTALGVVMVFVLVVLSLVVLKEGTIDQVLVQTGNVTGDAKSGAKSDMPAESLVIEGNATSEKNELASSNLISKVANLVTESASMPCIDPTKMTDVGTATDSDSDTANTTIGHANVIAPSSSDATNATTGLTSTGDTASNAFTDSAGDSGPSSLSSPAETSAEDAISAEDALIIACAKVSERFCLSDRESEVLVLLAEGKTIEQISQELYISFNTSKSHVRHVYTKTDVHSRKELLSLISDEQD